MRAGSPAPLTPQDPFNAKRCDALGESLLGQVTSIVQQLVYAASTDVLDDSAQLWIAGAPSGRGPASTCPAFSLASRSVVSVKCSTRLATLCTNAGSDAVTVQAGPLAITGTRTTKAHRFLSLPFAAPPVGSLRFQPAAAYKGSSTIDARSFGKACPQSSVGTGLESSEDCLTLKCAGAERQ